MTNPNARRDKLAEEYVSECFPGMREEHPEEFRAAIEVHEGASFKAGYDAAIEHIQKTIDTNKGGNAKWGLLEGAFWGPYLNLAKMKVKIHHVIFGFPGNPVAVIDFVDAKHIDAALTEAQKLVKALAHARKFLEHELSAADYQRFLAKSQEIENGE